MKSRSGSPAFPIVLAAPSGTGKTTVARRLVSTRPDFVFCVSATTRAPRSRERDGVDYDFISREAFEAMVRDRGLAEWAEVHGNLYGTPKVALAAATGAGKWPVLDIDVQGARQVRTAFPAAALIFLLPPTARELWRRLRLRGTEERAELARRLRAARHELRAAGEFDHIVVNDDVDGTVAALLEIAEGGAAAAQQRRAGEPARILREIDALLVEEGIACQARSAAGRSE